MNFNPSEAKWAYIPQLDGLRAICAIFTLLNHIHHVPKWINGTIGVDIFFSLSGFLITSILIKEFSATSSISLRAFYVRRFFRIAPLYITATFATAAGAYVLSCLFHNNEKLQYVISSLPWILTFNRELCTELVCGATYFGHAWTIGIEEKFYILWPILFLISKKYSKLSSLIVAIIFILSAFIWLPANMIRGYIGLAFGCFVAIWSTSNNNKSGRKLEYIFWLSIIFLGYIVSIKIGYLGNLLVSFGSAWLIVSIINHPKGPIAKILENNLLVWVGKLTYGIYLFHVLTLNVAEIIVNKFIIIDQGNRWIFIFLVGYLLVIIIAFFLHLIIEKPLINLGKSIGASLKISSQSIK